MRESKLIITTADGLELEAILFSSKEQKKGVVLLAPGLGIPKEFYSKYARYLTEHGYEVLVFDFRGIGDVHLKIKNQQKINLRNWAIQDMVAVIAFLEKNYPEQKIYGLLHSIGGQILGLAENHDLLERVITISTVGGYWRDERFPVNLSTWYLWYIHIPLLTFIFGYLPQGLTYRGKAIAKGVAKEWASWGRKKRYISAFFGKTIQKQYYAEIFLQIDAIWFTDDVLVTEKTLSSVLDYYENATLKRWPLNPENYERTNIGHSGFFSSKSKGALWQLTLDILEGKYD